MQFLYHPLAGDAEVLLEGESYQHLFRSRRHDREETLWLRNLTDDYRYCYQISHVARKAATLSRLAQEESRMTPHRALTIGWCSVDNKTVEKTLPFLNELGVTTLALIQCARSQIWKPDWERYRRILINSSQQCGRSSLMEMAWHDSLEQFLKAYPQAHAMDFGGQKGFDSVSDSIVIGCEGGITDEEKELFGERLVGMNSSLILRSETAAITAAARLLS